MLYGNYRNKQHGCLLRYCLMYTLLTTYCLMLITRPMVADHLILTYQ